MSSLLNRFGAQAVHAVAGGHIEGSRLNMKLGFALLRDRRVGIWPKLLSLAVGGAVTALLVALEIAPEAVLSAILPVLGIALDAVADGMEALILPVLIGALALPFVAPRHLVDTIMAERSGVTLEEPPPIPAR